MAKPIEKKKVSYNLSGTTLKLVRSFQTEIMRSSDLHEVCSALHIMIITFYHACGIPDWETVLKDDLQTMIDKYEEFLESQVESKGEVSKT